MDNATSALARMNMILHDCPTAEIWQDNTLASAALQGRRTGGLKTFDFVVANPPFSTKAWSNGFNPANDEFGRFAFGIPPAKNGDYAFLLHILACLKSTGKGAVILPHGVLFRGSAEATIRREIVRRGYIKGIIGLPANLFYGTGIPACIIVLDKENAAARKGIFMIDASQGLHQGRQQEPPARAGHPPDRGHLHAAARDPALLAHGAAGRDRDPKNDFNLNLPRYIDSTEPEDLQDIDAHLRGGIPDRDIDALDRYWQVFPGVRARAVRAGRSARLQPAEGRRRPRSRPRSSATPSSPRSSTQVTRVVRRSGRRPARRGSLASPIGDQPKALIEIAFRGACWKLSARPGCSTPTTCTSTSWTTGPRPMQDDVYLMLRAGEGWKADVWTRTRPNTDLTIGSRSPTDPVASSLLRRRAGRHRETRSRARCHQPQMEELDEEHGGEEGCWPRRRPTRASSPRRASRPGSRKSRATQDAADERKVLERVPRS